MTSNHRRLAGRKMGLLPMGLLLILTSACGSSPMMAENPGSYKTPDAPPAQPAAEAAAMAGVDAAPAPAQPRQRPARHHPAGKPLPPPVSGGQSARSAKEIAPDASKVSSVEQMIIFSSRLEMEVDAGDVSATIDKVVDIAADLGGYIHEQTDTSVTVRVPSADFRDAMREMEKHGEVIHRSVKAQDVSEEFHDLNVRLKSLMATRARMQKFLERAKTINEVLRVEQELVRLNGEIDKIQGRMRYLQARSAFSTITVQLRARRPAPKKVVQPKRTPPPTPPPRTPSLPIQWLQKVGVDNLLRLK